jgi:hypothetical protein
MVMQHDGSNSARARSARIRTSHEYESTQLDSMRRNTVALGAQQRGRPSLAARLVSAFGRARRASVEPQRLSPAAEGDE